MKRALPIFAVLIIATTAWATKIIPNGSTSQSITVVIKDATGAPATGVTIANLDLYCVKDGDQLSAKTDLSALDSDHAAWSSGKAFEIGLGLYRIDIPDANLSDGIGTMLTYAIDDAVGTNQTAFYEVQLGVAVDVNTVDGTALPVSAAVLFSDLGSAPANWSSLVISAGGAVDVNAADIFTATARTNMENVFVTDYATAFNTTSGLFNVHVKAADDNVIFDVNAVDVATAVWNAATASYGTANTYGASVEALSSGSGASVEEILAGDIGGITVKNALMAILGKR